jgi:myo-inositol-1(or 4)-monophosphatase
VREFEVCREAVRLGSEVVARYYRDGVTMRSKESYNLVSDADVEAEQCIGEFIHRNFADHAVLGEEVYGGGGEKEEHLWVVDPIDGTNNFAHRVPQFAVSVAYYHRGQPVCGVVSNPVREDWYEATRGGGAFHNGSRVRVGSQMSLDEVLVGVGFYYDRGAMMEATLDAIRELFGRDIHGIRRFGAASLDLCQVGEGSLGVFFEYQLSPWDFAAGRLFVEEAGGRVTTCRGEALPLKKTSLLASNSHLHEPALEILRRHLPE